MVSYIYGNLLKKLSLHITSFHFTEKDISLTIKKLDPTKAHGCENISINL